MKIVTKAELMAMPKGTPFAEYSAERWTQGFDIFVCASGDNDFLYRNTCYPDAESSEQCWDRQVEMDDDSAAYPADLSIGREGLYDASTRYLVWEPDDVRRIIHLLQGGDDEMDD